MHLCFTIIKTERKTFIYYLRADPGPPTLVPRRENLRARFRAGPPGELERYPVLLEHLLVEKPAGLKIHIHRGSRELPDRDAMLQKNHHVIPC